MKTRDLIRKSGVCVITAGLLLTTIAFADGIPEPGLVMYGTVTNTAGPFMLLSGSAQWTVFGSGSSAAVTPTIASVNGQFFYVVRIPFKTHFTGNLKFTPSPNTLPLTATSLFRPMPVPYQRLSKPEQPQITPAALFPEPRSSGRESLPTIAPRPPRAAPATQPEKNEQTDLRFYDDVVEVDVRKPISNAECGVSSAEWKPWPRHLGQRLGRVTPCAPLLELPRAARRALTRPTLGCGNISTQSFACL